MFKSNIDDNRHVDKYKDKVLGLVVADMYRAILEERKDSDDVIKDFEKYTPSKNMDLFSRPRVRSLLKHNLKDLIKSFEKKSALQGEMRFW